MHSNVQKTRLFHAFSINLPTFAGYLPLVYVVSGNGTFTISNLVWSSYHIPGTWYMYHIYHYHYSLFLFKLQYFSQFIQFICANIHSFHLSALINQIFSQALCYKILCSLVDNYQAQVSQQNYSWLPLSLFVNDCAILCFFNCSMTLFLLVLWPFSSAICWFFLFH